MHMALSQTHRDVAQHGHVPSGLKPAGNSSRCALMNPVSARSSRVGPSATICPWSATRKHQHLGLHSQHGGHRGASPLAQRQLVWWAVGVALVFFKSYY
jgi:hypothetical protein